MATSSTPLPKNMGELETVLDNIFGKKAPALPENVKEMIVKYGPYITVVLLVMAAPAILAIFGLGTVLAPFSLLSGVSGFSIYTITMILSLIIFALQIIALPGLFKRTMAGWRFMFYGSLVSAVSSLLSMNIGSLVISTAISFYFLFQIRGYYK
jgi:hypothetical protein